MGWGIWACGSCPACPAWNHVFATVHVEKDCLGHFPVRADCCRGGRPTSEVRVSSRWVTQFCGGRTAECAFPDLARSFRVCCVWLGAFAVCELSTCATAPGHPAQGPSGTLHLGVGVSARRAELFLRPEQRLWASLPAFSLWNFANKTLTQGQKVQLKIAQQISSIYQVHMQPRSDFFFFLTLCFHGSLLMVIVVGRAIMSLGMIVIHAVWSNFALLSHFLNI